MSEMGSTVCCRTHHSVQIGFPPLGIPPSSLWRCSSPTTLAASTPQGFAKLRSLFQKIALCVVGAVKPREGTRVGHETNGTRNRPWAPCYHTMTSRSGCCDECFTVRSQGFSHRQRVRVTFTNKCLENGLVTPSFQVSR